MRIYETIKNELLLPLARRAASNVATASVAIGVTTAQASVLEAAFVILVGVAIDLVASFKQRRGVS